jgi:hypothetical protein
MAAGVRYLSRGLSFSGMFGIGTIIPRNGYKGWDDCQAFPANHMAWGRFRESKPGPIDLKSLFLILPASH